jgi:hypothetical protein
MAAAKSKKASRKAPWRKPNPKAKTKTSRKLTPAQKAAAKARAKTAGRPYPNLVDNMAVAKTANARKRKA